MAQSAFKTAFERAGMTREQFAEIVEVDPKTVQRWISGRTPYKRYRVVIARALDTPEHELWPDDVPAPTPASVQPSGTEVVEQIAFWFDPEDLGAPDLGRFIAQAEDGIDVLDGGSQIAHHPNVISALAARAVPDCPVRVVVNVVDPQARLDSPTSQSAMEVRRHEYGSAVAMIRAGQKMLFALRLSGGPSSLLLITRDHEHGLFDRLVDHFEARWQEARPIEPNDQQTAPTAANAQPRPSPARVRHWPKA